VPSSRTEVSADVHRLLDAWTDRPAYVRDRCFDVLAANKQARALEEALDRKVRIEKVPYRKASAPSIALVNNSVAVSLDPAQNSSLRKTAKATAHRAGR
jgi:hypothetical protein